MIEKFTSWFTRAQKWLINIIIHPRHTQTYTTRKRKPASTPFYTLWRLYLFFTCQSQFFPLVRCIGKVFKCVNIIAHAKKMMKVIYRNKSAKVYDGGIKKSEEEKELKGNPVTHIIVNNEAKKEKMNREAICLHLEKSSFFFCDVRVDRWKEKRNFDCLITVKRGERTLSAFVRNFSIFYFIVLKLSRALPVTGKWLNLYPNNTRLSDENKFIFLQVK